MNSQTKNLVYKERKCLALYTAISREVVGKKCTRQSLLFSFKLLMPFSLDFPEMLKSRFPELELLTLPFRIAVCAFFRKPFSKYLYPNCKPS